MKNKLIKLAIFTIIMASSMFVMYSCRKDLDMGLQGIATQKNWKGVSLAEARAFYEAQPNKMFKSIDE